MSRRNLSLLLITALCLIVSLFTVPVFGAEKGDNPKTSKKQFFKKKSHLIKDLRFGDFPLVTDFQGDKTKLQKYTTEVLQEQYKATPRVFSSAIPYGLALIDLDQIDKAYDIFDQAEKDFIGNPTPKAYKGWVLGSTGDYQKAYEYLYPLAKEKYDAGVIGFSSGIWLASHIDSIIGLALIKDKLPQEEKENATVIVDAVMKYFKGQPKVTAIKVVNDINRGNFEEAKKKIEYVKSIGQDYPLLDTLLGAISYAEGDFEESLKHFDLASETNPYSPTNYLMRARTLLALGEKEKALDSIDLALEYDPNYEFASEEKQKILNPKKSFFSVLAGIFTRDSKQN